MATLSVKQEGNRVVMTSSYMTSHNVFDFSSQEEASAAMERALEAATEIFERGDAMSLRVTKRWIDPAINPAA